MEKGRVLLVSDSPDRRSFLEYHVRNCDFMPIWYSNIISVRKAIQLYPFSMVVIDLSLPVDSRLALVREVCHHQGDAKVVIIEEAGYLKKTGALSSEPSIVSLESIESFPDRLSEYGT